jgi:glycosyltransferase involved in cell wall biosynthesis
MREIAHVCKYYPPFYGGIPGYVERLSRRLREYYRVTVLASNTSRRHTDEADGSLRVIRVPRLLELRSTALCPAMPRELATLRPDIVHLHFPDPMAHLAYKIARPGGKLVVSWHADIVRQKLLLQFYRPFLRSILHQADAVVVSSPSFRDSSSFLEGVRERCVIIPYGLDTKAFELTAGVRERVETLRRQHGERVILFVGRITHYKGLDILLEAVRGLEARLMVIGGGPLKSAMQRRGVELGVSDKVTFLGEVPHDELVAQLYSCAVFVLPSVNRSEAFGIVQLEAMACSKPIVSTDIPTGVPWVNQHAVTGFIVPAGDSGALRSAMGRLLDDPELRHKFGQAGRRRLDAEFSQQRHIRRMVNLYESLMEGAEGGTCCQKGRDVLDPQTQSR